MASDVLVAASMKTVDPPQLDHITGGGVVNGGACLLGIRHGSDWRAGTKTFCNRSLKPYGQVLTERSHSNPERR
jgi:hypothetical protein